MEFDYPLQFAKLGKECGVKYFGFISGEGVSKTSWIYLFKIKAELEEELK